MLVFKASWPQGLCRPEKRAPNLYAHLLLVLQYLFYGSSVTEHLPEALLLMLLEALWPVRANHDPQAPITGPQF
jgi:hypothetical protein